MASPRARPGETRGNPWDRSRTCGGSSGGSGGWRWPRASPPSPTPRMERARSATRPPYCGLFGLKPQRNRISLSPDREHWYGLSVSGCVSRTVADTALYLDVMSGPERGDFDSPPPLDRPLVEAPGRSPGSCGSPARPRRSSRAKGAGGDCRLRGDRRAAPLTRARGDGGEPQLRADVHRLLPTVFPGDPRRGPDPAASRAALRSDQELRQGRQGVQRPAAREGPGPDAGRVRTDHRALSGTTTS